MMMRISTQLYTISLIVILFLQYQSVAQVLEISGDTLYCQPDTATLNASISVPFYTTTNTANAYTVSQINYSPEAVSLDAQNVNSVLVDDMFYGPFPIGFDFCFFGSTFSQFYVGSNGWISFTPHNTTLFDSWQTHSIPFSNPGGNQLPNNVIFGVWRDTHPGLGGSIVYECKGYAPFRKLVVSFREVPLYSCTSTNVSSQIVIHESSNTIENHLIEMPTCSTWNLGNGVQGIMNQDRTIAISVPGRNNTPFIASHESWCYTPIGSQFTQFNWYDEYNNFLGSGSLIELPVITTTTISCNLELCATTLYDTITLYVAGTSINPELTFSNPTCFNSNDGVCTIELDSPFLPVNYYWSNGQIMTGSYNTQADFGNFHAGNYQLTITDAQECVHEFEVLIEGPDPITIVPEIMNADFGNNIAGFISLDVEGGTPPYNYQWTNGATTPYATIYSPGTYDVTVSDVNGCERIRYFHFDEEGTVSVEETKLINGITVFPNPAHDYFIIKTNTGFTGEIKLINSEGKSLETYSVYKGNTAPINTTNLPRGLYILVFRNNEQFSQLKLVIQ